MIRSCPEQTPILARDCREGKRLVNPLVQRGAGDACDLFAVVLRGVGRRLGRECAALLQRRLKDRDPLDEADDSGARLRGFDMHCDDSATIRPTTLPKREALLLNAASSGKVPNDAARRPARHRRAPTIGLAFFWINRYKPAEILAFQRISGRSSAW